MSCKHPNPQPYQCNVIHHCEECRTVAVCPACGATLKPCDLAAAQAAAAAEAAAAPPTEETP